MEAREHIFLLHYYWLLWWIEHCSQTAGGKQIISGDIICFENGIFCPAHRNYHRIRCESLFCFGIPRACKSLACRNCRRRFKGSAMKSNLWHFIHSFKHRINYHIQWFEYMVYSIYLMSFLWLYIARARQAQGNHTIFKWWKWWNFGVFPFRRMFCSILQNKNNIFSFSAIGRSLLVCLLFPFQQTTEISFH